MSFVDGFFNNTNLDVLKISIDHYSDASTTKEEGEKMWKKVTSKMTANQENTLLLVELGKKKDLEGNIAKRCFCVTKTHIFYCRKSSYTHFRGSFELSWARIGFELVQEQAIQR
jgi:hypothetical protein